MVVRSWVKGYWGVPLSEVRPTRRGAPLVTFGSTLAVWRLPARVSDASDFMASLTRTVLADATTLQPTRSRWSLVRRPSWSLGDESVLDDGFAVVAF